MWFKTRRPGRTAALPLAASAMAILPMAAAAACGTDPCVVKDRLVSAHGYAAVSVAAHRPASLLVVSSGQLDSPGLSCKSTVAVHTSTDDGRHWLSHCMPAMAAHYLHSPQLAFDERGVLYAASTAEPWEGGVRPVMHRSTDAGATWRALDVGSPGYGRDGRGHSMRLAVDNSPASAYRGSVYGVMAVSTNEYVEAYVFFTASRDGGRTWDQGAASPHDREVGRMVYPSLAIDRAGGLFLTYVQCRAWGVSDCAGADADLMLSTSTDGGSTWQPGGQIAQVPNSPFTPPVLAADATGGPWRGRLYSVRAALVNGVSQLRVATSVDGGRSWGPDVPVHASGAHPQYHPAAAVTAAGELVVSWIDRQVDQPGEPWQPMAAVSSDGGATFAAPVALVGPRKSRGDWFLTGMALAVSGQRVHATYVVHDKAGDPGVHLGGLKP
ncbi:MAG: exo-alpha-sialidase [Burkholderiales bacterium]|nr:exo-alpha-sialidase [Burkholderiales bacterium]